MNSYGYWAIGLTAFYTFFLIVISRIAKKKSQQGTDGFFIGSRSFGSWTVAFCIIGLFSGSTFISILELSYLKGISSMWYGLAELSHLFVIAFFVIIPYRRMKIITISGLIGDKYGRLAKGIAGTITALTFPMWSVGTSLAFASSINALTGLDMFLCIALTAILLFAFLQAGGMWSLALVQTANFFVIMVMLAIGFYAFIVNPGFAGLSSLKSLKPELFALNNAGVQTIIAWFGTFWINILLAQAAFQMALSCQSEKEGQRGLFIASGFNVVFIIAGILTGLGAVTVLPGQTRGLIAVIHYLAQTLPAPLVGIFSLGLWCCALSWGGPCQFSGATSLGRDVGTAVNPDATEKELVRYTKGSLVFLTFLMILLGSLRSEQAAWWNIFAWTARNGATFAPLVSALFWPAANKQGVNSALIAGFFTGLIWNYLGNWDAESFYLNIHPVWVSMSANILFIILFSLIGRKKASFIFGRRHLTNFTIAFTIVAIVAAVALLLFFALNFSLLMDTGLLGIVGFLFLLSLWSTVISYVIPGDNSERCRS